MKQIIRTSIFIVGLMCLVSSCEENEIPVLDPNGQVLVEFDQSSITIPTPEEGASKQVKVYVTNTSTSERSIDVSVDPSSTATSDQYTISDLVIPANSYVGTITISGNYNAIPENGSSNLILNLNGVGGVQTQVSDGTLNVELFRTCPIEPSQFVGNWTGSGSWGNTDFDYATEVTTTLDDDGNLLINGLVFQWFTGWWSEIIITNEPVKMEIDPETGEITIEEQFYITSTYNGDPQPAYNIKATGMVLNACSKTIEIYPTLVQGGAAIDGTAWGPRFVETIQLQQP